MCPGRRGRAAPSRRRRGPSASPGGRERHQSVHLGHEVVEDRGADSPAHDTSDLSSLQCFWYGASPMSPIRLEEALTRIGPVMAQIFGQTEAPMMISTMAPRDHFHADGGLRPRVAPHRRHLLPRRRGLPLPGRPRKGHGDHGRLQRLLHRGRAGADGAPGDRGLCGDRPARPEVGRPGHRCAPGRTGHPLDLTEITDCVKQRLGSVKARKQIEVWDDLPRSKVGKVLKSEIKERLGPV